MDQSDAIYRYCRKIIEDDNDVAVRLESEWELAKRFGVTRRAARCVLQRLVREGFATAERGRGYFSVRRPAVRPDRGASCRVGVVFERVPAYQSQVQERIVSLVSDALTRYRLESVRLPVSPTSNRMAQNGSVDGYVLISLTPAAQLEYSHQKLPVVILGNTYEDLKLSNVYLDNLEITQDLCGRLFDAGHRKIALLQHKSRNLGRERSRIGFALAHHARQIRFRRSSVIRVPPTATGIKKCFKALSARPFTAVLVENRDLLAMLWEHAPRNVREQFERYEIAEIDEGVADTCPLPFHRVRTDFPAAASMVASILAEVFDGRKGRPVNQKIPWQIVDSRKARARKKA